MRRRDRGITKREMVVVMLIIIALVTLLILLTTRTRERDRRARCARQLRAIGQAIMLYASDNKGQYPRTIATTGAVVTPTWGTGATAIDPFAPGGPEPNDVTAAFFLLLRTQDVTSEVFTCPSRSLKRWDFGGPSKTALDWSNWSDVRGQLSYSYRNPYLNDADAGMRSRFRVGSPSSAEDAIASDINPGSSLATPNLFTLTPTSSSRTMRRGNSPNHGREGQNVLYADGHVSFENNPFVGVGRDNIYTVKSDATAFTGNTYLDSPRDGHDSILLPTAK
jgi:prepilin-type processing-associated H-X9-DG protein